MQQASEAYAAAITGDRRWITPHVTISLIDPDIVYGDTVASSTLSLCRPEQLDHLGTEEGAHYITCEPGRFALDGTAAFFPETASEIPDEVGWISDAMSGADATFEAPCYLERHYENLQELQALSVDFPENDPGDWPLHLKISVYSGDALAESWEISDNNRARIALRQFHAYDVTCIRIDFYEMRLPYQRARVLKITPGIWQQWSARDIVSVDVLDEVNFACTAFPSASAKIEFDNSDLLFDPIDKDSLFASIQEGQGLPICYAVRLADGSWERVPVGVFYQKDAGWRTGTGMLTFGFELTDIRGMLRNRSFVAPETLPTTFEGWIAAAVSVLGERFAGHYIVPADVADASLTAALEDVEDLNCGDVIRYACMAVGCFARSDPATGALRCDLIPASGGSRIGLGDMTKVPSISANNDLASIVFTLSGGDKLTVAGTNSASSSNLNIKNPFLATSAQAIAAARNILIHYGGNKITVQGRGDMRTEPGDVDAIETAGGLTIAARRYKQQLSIKNSVMSGVPSYFLQASGTTLYETCEILTQSGSYLVPEDCTELYAILVGGGDGGSDGEDGTFNSAGDPGAAGDGAKILAVTIGVTPGASLAYTIAEGGDPGQPGGDTTFGSYTSADGAQYDGFTDIGSGRVYGLPGAVGSKNGNGQAGASAAANTGNGGDGGAGGVRGITGTDGTFTYIKRSPGQGGKGGAGGSGCVVIWRS